MAETATKITTKAINRALSGVPKMWTLYYHFGNTAPNTLNFPFEGTMTEAMLRAREHCQKMGYRFIKIRPFIVDLDDRERRKAEGKYADESIEL